MPTPRKPKTPTQTINAAGGYAAVALGAELTLNAATADDGVPSFSMVAYTGKMMRLAGFGYPVVVDLAGMTVPSQTLPVRMQHDPDKGIGHTTRIDKTDRTLTAAGLISRKTAFAEDARESGKNGFPWQASIGAQPDEVVFVPEKQTTTANGKTFKGPFYLVAKCTLGEISFVDRGGDDTTSVAVAAQQPQPHFNLEKQKMEIKQLKLLAAAFEEKLSAEKIAQAILAAHEADDDDAAFVARLEAMVAETPTPTAAATPSVGNGIQAAASGVDVGRVAREAVTAALIAETARRSAIRAEAEAFGISASTLNTLLDDTAVTLEAARGVMLKEVHRRHTPAIQAGGLAGAVGGDNGLRVIEAAAYMSCLGSEQAALTQYGDKVVEAASKLRLSGFGELFEICAAASGAYLPIGRGDNERIRAAFSITGLTDLLSNLANKALLEGYTPDEEIWPKVCKIGSVRDFKKNSRHRMIGHFEFKQLGAGGELKHGTLSNQKFEIQADTQGIMIVLTRQMIINDDLGAFLELFQMLGRGASDAINRDVWTLLENNADDFFGADNGNLPTVGDINQLSFEALSIARQAFRDQKSPNGTPLRISPKTLLVPTALESLAEMLMLSQQVSSTPGGLTQTSKYKPVENIHKGKYEVACSPDLTSATSWYLFGDPSRIAAMEVAFLNGQQAPTVEQAELAGDKLGAAFRSYIDYGVAKQDPKGAVKMAIA